MKTRHITNLPHLWYDGRGGYRLKCITHVGGKPRVMSERGKNGGRGLRMVARLRNGTMHIMIDAWPIDMYIDTYYDELEQHD